MKKRILKKLTLNKATIAGLNRIEMDESRGGAPPLPEPARPSRIGVSCYTGHCCYSKIECDINALNS